MGIYGIYLDNAATTMQKPASVIEAVAAAMGHMGNSAGRYGEALDASRIIYGTRERLGAGGTWESQAGRCYLQFDGAA